MSITIPKDSAPLVIEWLKKHRLCNSDDSDFLKNVDKYKHSLTNKQLVKLAAITARTIEIWGETRETFWDEINKSKKKPSQQELNKPKKPGLLEKQKLTTEITKDRNLTQGQKSILVILLDKIWMDTDTCTISLASLVEESSFTERYVCKVLEQLEEDLDLITRERSMGGKRKRSSYSNILEKCINRYLPSLSPQFRDTDGNSELEDQDKDAVTLNCEFRGIPQYFRRNDNYQKSIIAHKRDSDSDTSVLFEKEESTDYYPQKTRFDIYKENRSTKYKGSSSPEKETEFNIDLNSFSRKEKVDLDEFMEQYNNMPRHKSY